MQAVVGYIFIFMEGLRMENRIIVSEKDACQLSGWLPRGALEPGTERRPAARRVS